MTTFCKTLVPILTLLFAFSLFEVGISTDYAEARSMKGGRMFKMSPRKSAPKQTAKQAPGATQQKSGGFGRGLAGGLLGGALGGMLFGSMFGAGGTGMGILPILLLAGVAYFLFRKMSSKPRQTNYGSHGQGADSQSPSNMFGGGFSSSGQPPPSTPDIGANLVEEGLNQISESDRNFDPAYFKEIASDVFFQVQAGWMRRDLDSYRHLLGENLAGEYEQHFEEMRSKGHINKLESIAIRTIDIVEAGSDGTEDFITMIFNANLLDFTVDDKSGELVEGDMTTPVKFKEEWTWARPVGSQDWKLEGIKEG